MALTLSAPLGTRSVAEEFSSGSEAAPTTSETERGLFLDSVARCAVTLRTVDWFPSRAVFSGVGELEAWHLARGAASWARARECDLPGYPQLGGQSDASWSDVRLPPEGRLCFVPRGWLTDHGSLRVEYAAVDARGNHL